MICLMTNDFLKECDLSMSNIAEEILKTIKYAVDRKAINCDCTYKTGIRGIDKKGYVITDRAGGERAVQCSIPGVELKPGQIVWVKEPMGKLNEIHICGVAGKHK